MLENRPPSNGCVADRTSGEGDKDQHHAVGATLPGTGRDPPGLLCSA